MRKTKISLARKITKAISNSIDFLLNKQFFGFLSESSVANSVNLLFIIQVR
jgi:hypothetical protein